VFVIQNSKDCKAGRGEGRRLKCVFSNCGNGVCNIRGPAGPISTMYMLQGCDGLFLHLYLECRPRDFTEGYSKLFTGVAQYKRLDH